MSLLKDLRDASFHLLFPQLCRGCNEPLMKAEDTLCLSCYQQLSRTGYHLFNDNEAALRFAGRVPYQFVTALGHFVEDGLLQHLLHELKYKKKQDVGLFLGRQLGHDLAKSNWHHEIDLIIPLPLHPKKEAQRGFNQTALIANGLSESLSKTVNDSCLRRIRFTESQVMKSRQERIENMKGAFSVHNPALIRGKHVLLIDDVLTTGATLEAAALQILTVPGVRVSMATIGLAAS